MIALNRTRFEQGDISELELTRIGVERLRFADDLFQARLELRNAKAALLALLYAPDLGADVEVLGDLALAGRPLRVASLQSRRGLSHRPGGRRVAAHVDSILKTAAIGLSCVVSRLPLSQILPSGACNWTSK